MDNEDYTMLAKPGIELSMPGFVSHIKLNSFKNCGPQRSFHGYFYFLANPIGCNNVNRRLAIANRSNFSVLVHFRDI